MWDMVFALAYPGLETENWDCNIVPALDTLIHKNDMLEIFVFSGVDTPDDHWRISRLFYCVWARTWSRRNSGIRSRWRSFNFYGLFIFCAGAHLCLSAFWGFFGSGRGCWKLKK